MPLSAAQLTSLKASVDAVVGEVATLVADPDPNPLQVALDAANATIALRDAALADAAAANAALQAKIDAAKIKLAEAAAADVAEDAGRTGALAALG